MDHLQSVSEPYADLPCLLEANGPKRLVSTALIEAIHMDSRPWNYSSAATCEEHIKLRLPEPTFLKRSNVIPKVICRIPKSRKNSLKDSTGSLYHPYIWQFQKGKMGLSFSSFNLSHALDRETPSLPNMTTGGGSGGGGGEEDQNDKNQYWLDPDPAGRQFVQIVFTTRFGGMCTVRVQQYLVDPKKNLCGDMQTNSPFRLCGMYDCSEKENILRTLGFWTHRKVHDQLDILMQANLNPRWRRDEPSYLEILVSTLRALIMPLLFLSVFYVTRRLRLKVANRNINGLRSARTGDRRNVLRQRQCYLRSLLREGNNNNSSGSSDSGSADHMLRPSLILNHVVYDIPVGGEYPVYDDLPPPYESIVQPPSYHVATTQVKQASSPCPMVGVGEVGGIHSQSGHQVIVPTSSLPPPFSAVGDVGQVVEREGSSNINEGTYNLANIVNSPSHHHPHHSSSSNVPVFASQQSDQSNHGSRTSILDDDAIFQSPMTEVPPSNSSLTHPATSPTAHAPPPSNPSV